MDDKRIRNNKVLSWITGVFFTTAWWLFLDSIFKSVKAGYGYGKYFEYIPGLASTLGFFLINNLPSDLFIKNSYGDNDYDFSLKIVLIFSTILLFGSIIESIWVLSSMPMFEENDIINWRGVSAVFQSFLNLISTFICRFMWRSPY